MNFQIQLINISHIYSQLQQYQAAVLQRDQAIQQLSEQSRQLQEQNRQLQTPSRTASEDGIDYAGETDTLKLQVSLLKEQLEQVSYLIPGYIIQPIINYRV